MPNPDLPANGPGDQPGRPDGQNKEHKTFATYVRFDIPGLFKHAVGQVKQYHANKESKHPYRDAICVAVLLAFMVGFSILAWRTDNQANKVIAIFTVVLAWTTYRQWRAMHEQTISMVAQNKAIEAQVVQMRLEQRAWIGVSPPSGISSLDAGKYGEVKVNFQNTGNTPAKVTGYSIHVIRSGTSVTLEDAIKEAQREDEFPQSHRTIIAPSATTPLPQTLTSQLDAAWLHAFMERNHSLYVAGIMCYRIEGDGRIHRTRFCFVWNHDSSEFEWCSDHNDMD
jgi:cell division protein FtsB